MNAERIGSKAALPPDRAIGVKHLPIGVIDIELSMPPTELVDDTTVFLLVSEHGSPAAVLKVARGLLGRLELRAQRRVLSELATHRGLDSEWRELLPRILAFDGRGSATVSVESFRPGIGMDDLLARRPDRIEQLTAAALTAIAPLHRRTATFVGVSNGCALRRWLAEGLTALTDMCHRLDPGRAPTAERLSTALLRDVRGWQLPLGWTHGGYLPGNVRVEGLEGRVTGIVDWGGARSGRPALIDEYLLILAASCQVDGAALGAVVTARLRAGGLLEWERNAQRAAHQRCGADDVAGGVDERTAILLSWLHRVADVWRKRSIHPNHHVWWAANVAPVLDVASGWRPVGDVGPAEAKHVEE